MSTRQTITVTRTRLAEPRNLRRNAMPAIWPAVAWACGIKWLEALSDSRITHYAEARLAVDAGAPQRQRYSLDCNSAAASRRFPSGSEIARIRRTYATEALAP